MTVAELCAALRICRAASHVVEVLRPEGEGGAAAVTRACTQQATSHPGGQQGHADSKPLNIRFVEFCLILEL